MPLTARPCRTPSADRRQRRWTRLRILSAADIIVHAAAHPLPADGELAGGLESVGPRPPAARVRGGVRISGQLRERAERHQLYRAAISRARRQRSLRDARPQSCRVWDSADPVQGAAARPNAGREKGKALRCFLVARLAAHAALSLLGTLLNATR